jgi:hypothetical protein
MDGSLHSKENFVLLEYTGKEWKKQGQNGIWGEDKQV